MRQKLTGILGLLAAFGVSAGLSSCTSVPKSYETTHSRYKYQNETNNVYRESNFYGEVVNIKPIVNEKNQSDDKDQPKYEIVIVGERGTVVTVKTNESYDLNEQVLFKSSRNSNIATVIRLKDLDVSRELYVEPTQMPRAHVAVNGENLYRDISSEHSPIYYQNTSKSPDYLDYQKVE